MRLFNILVNEEEGKLEVEVLNRLDVIVEHVIEGLLDIQSGLNRLVALFSHLRAIQQAHGVAEEQLMAENLRELQSHYKQACQTRWSSDASTAIWQGLARYGDATGDAAPSFSPNVVGRYVYLYRHPSEPRFGGITASKGWQLLEPGFESWFNNTYQPLTRIYNLRSVAMMALSRGWKDVFRFHSCFQIPETTMENREIQSSHGALVKTGKVLEHVLCTDGFDQNRMSTLAGYVQDAMRVGIASVELVQTSEDVGSIYRLGGNFTSCMRSLGWDDTHRGNDSFQIYRDLGARIAYIVVPEMGSDGQPLRDRNGNLIMRLTARAILWDHVEIVRRRGEEPITIKLMDTIYRDSSKEQACMVKWARQHGYAYKKTEQAYSCSSFTYGPDRSDEDFELNDFYSCRVYRIDDKIWARGMYSRVPWVDIFPYAREGEDFLTHEAHSNTACLHSQNGNGGFLTLVVKCQFCETELTGDDDDWREYNERWTCPLCYDLHWGTCNECDDEYPLAEMEEVGEDKYVCRQCFERYYVTCVDCGEHFHTRKDSGWSHASNGEIYCDDCFSSRFTWCECCQKYEYEEEVNWYDDLDQTICNTCFQEYYQECDECGHIFGKDECRDVNITYNNEGKIYRRTSQLCEGCREKLDAVSCDICGERWDTLDPRREEVGEEDFLCCDCFRDRYIKCNSCNEWRPNAEVESRFVTGIGLTRVCDECWKQETGTIYQCHGCQKHHSDTMGKRIVIGFETLCPFCFKSILRQGQEFVARISRWIKN